MLTKTSSGDAKQNIMLQQSSKKLLVDAIAEDTMAAWRNFNFGRMQKEAAMKWAFKHYWELLERTIKR